MPSAVVEQARDCAASVRPQCATPDDSVAEPRAFHAAQLLRNKAYTAVLKTTRPAGCIQSIDRQVPSRIFPHHLVLNTASSSYVAFYPVNLLA